MAPLALQAAVQRRCLAPLPICRSARLDVRCHSTQQESSALARRSLLATLGGAMLLANVKSSEAAYGDAPRVFGGKPTNDSGFVTYKGDEFSLQLPARWVETRERDSRNVKLRYEDTYPANNLLVYAGPSDKKSVTDYGGPEKFVKEVAFLFGDNVWQGTTRSEGGFKANQVSTASILESGVTTGKDGKPHINAHILTRSADGNEGGKHHVISATVSGGKLWIMKAQIGDKRWNKGGSKDSKRLQESFAVA